jgi:hypothetical protein
MTLEELIEKTNASRPAVMAALGYTEGKVIKSVLLRPVLINLLELISGEAASIPDETFQAIADGFLAKAMDDTNVAYDIVNKIELIVAGDEPPTMAPPPEPVAEEVPAPAFTEPAAPAEPEEAFFGERPDDEVEAEDEAPSSQPEPVAAADPAPVEETVAPVEFEVNEEPAAGSAVQDVEPTPAKPETAPAETSDTTGKRGRKAGKAEPDAVVAAVNEAIATLNKLHKENARLEAANKSLSEENGRLKAELAEVKTGPALSAAVFDKLTAAIRGGD